jgi:hypothetical protein
MVDIRMTIRRKELWNLSSKETWNLSSEEQRQILVERANRLEQMHEFAQAAEFRHLANSGTISYQDIDLFLHHQRAELLHSFADQLSLHVKDWGYTDNDEQHREIVEIIIALGSAGVISAIVTIIKAWLDKDKIQEATISLPNGTKLDVKGVTAEELQSFINITSHL